MTSKYVIWTHAAVEHAVVLDEMKGYDDDFRLVNGERVAKGFPSKVKFTMDKEFPTDTLLTDNLLNSDRLIVASERLADFLRERDSKLIEYLPVTIVDHKRKPIKEPYFIAHPVDPVDCLDIEACGAKYLPIDEDNIWKLDRLAVQESKVSAQRMLFRPKAYNAVILVRRDLANAISKEGFTGVSWTEIEDHPKPRRKS